MPLRGLDEELPAEIAEHGDDPVPLDGALAPGAFEPEVSETDPAASDAQRQATAVAHNPASEDDLPLADDPADD